MNKGSAWMAWALVTLACNTPENRSNTATNAPPTGGTEPNPQSQVGSTGTPTAQASTDEADTAAPDDSAAPTESTLGDETDLPTPSAPSTGSDDATEAGGSTQAGEDSVAVSPGASQDGAVSEPVVDCTGTFGVPRLLFDDEGMDNIGTPSITGDELSIFYVEAASSLSADSLPPPARIVHRDRPSLSEPFSAPIVVSELEGQCEGEEQLQAVWVSRDGLRLYWYCSAEEGARNGELRSASRASRTLSFTLSGNTLGTVGPLFSLSSNELKLVTYSTDPTEGAGFRPIVLLERASLDAPFANPTKLVDELPHLQAPELGPDGLTLFGARVITGGGAPLVLVMGTPNPASGEVESFTTEGLPTPTAEDQDTGPTLSDDCKRIYFVRVGVGADTSSTTYTRGIYVAER